MARTKGARNKMKKKTMENNVIEDPLLPVKSLFRVDEAADYLNVSTSTIRLWIDHGILEAEKYKRDDQQRGMIRVPRISLLRCRFNAKFDPML